MMPSIQDFTPDANEKVVVNNDGNRHFSHLIIDSRNIMFPSQSLFFAIKGNVRDGHDFISQAYDAGVRNFVISNEEAIKKYVDINYIVSSNVVDVLQKMVKFKRQKFNKIKSIGITGSNGKTVVKEWLSVILSKQYSIIKSPKSFNSQIGVPLSVWPITEEHEIGLFEAGISTYGEMQKLEQIIQPEIGILTNIGDAHEHGFQNKQDKLEEKLKLFKNVKYLIYNGDDQFIKQSVDANNINSFTWGYDKGNEVVILNKVNEANSLNLTLRYKENTIELNISTFESIYLENLMHCITAALLLGINASIIEESVLDLKGLEMRLQLSEGKDGCLIIDDSYTNDKQALEVALQFLEKHAGHRKRIVILSEMDYHQTTLNFDDVVSTSKLEKLYLVGSNWVKENSENTFVQFCDDIDTVINLLAQSNLNNTIILLKGARKFKFEKIFSYLISKSHSVTLNIDLRAIEHNLSVFASLLKGNTQIVPIIKASAYGSGSIEIAKLLQHKGVYALGVAFADEGMILRKAGITIPVIVLNADSESYQIIFDYNLEMEVYSMNQLRSITNWSGGLLLKNKIHIKLDTGMSRLGFRKNEISELTNWLSVHKFSVASIFSHLSSSEDFKDDNFSHQQAESFISMYKTISDQIRQKPKRHLLNSSGIIRFPEYHYELVRLGLGLYGIDGTEELQQKLEKVHQLTARIIQIKTLGIGDYIGYNRKYKVSTSMKIGILNIGYADGFMRAASNKYKVNVHGTMVDVVGNICMDLAMIDLSQIQNVSEGDEVIIFGQSPTIEELAKACETIPYELLCRIAPRVKRNYIQ